MSAGPPIRPVPWPARPRPDLTDPAKDQRQELAAGENARTEILSESWLDAHREIAKPVIESYYNALDKTQRHDRSKRKRDLLEANASWYLQRSDFVTRMYAKATVEYFLERLADLKKCIPADACDVLTRIQKEFKKEGHYCVRYTIPGTMKQVYGPRVSVYARIGRIILGILEREEPWDPPLKAGLDLDQQANPKSQPLPASLEERLVDALAKYADRESAADKKSLRAKSLRSLLVFIMKSRASERDALSIWKQDQSDLGVANDMIAWTVQAYERVIRALRDLI